MHAFHLLPTTLLASVTLALQLPDLQPFLSALPTLLQDYLPEQLQNATAHELLKKRQDTNNNNNNACPNDFRSCAALGAPGLCCLANAVCAPDQAGHVACCPSGAVCTGAIAGVITAGTINGNNGALVGPSGAPGVSDGLAGSVASTTSFRLFSSTSTTTNGLVAATAPPGSPVAGGAVGGNGGFVVAGTSTVATPGAAGRAAQVPLVARAILRVLEFLPI